MNNFRKTNLTKHDFFVVLKMVTLIFSLFSIPVWIVAGLTAVEDISYQLPLYVSDFTIGAAYF